MREVVNGILTWGGAYSDLPWDLNGYAIRLDEGAVLVDPPLPTTADWLTLDSLQPIQKIILTNRDHDRAARRLRERYRSPIVAGASEVGGFASLKIDEWVQDGDFLAGGLRVIHLPGKTPGEIGLYLDSSRNKISSKAGGIVLLGDALVGFPPGHLRFVPEHKLENPTQLRESLRKLLAFEFEVLLLCDGHSVLNGARRMVDQFLAGHS